MLNRLLGFTLGLIAPIVMLLGSVFFIGDFFRVRRMRTM
jgi:hypothetical protein